jgi:hypothetical protein
MTIRLIVFIHGLGGNAEGTWAKFPLLMSQDQQVLSQYQYVESFQYETKKIGTTKPLAEIAHELAQFIDAKVTAFHLDEVAFITHSQGGLLARRYLCDQLIKKRSESDANSIFRLLTFATPHWGAYSEKFGKFVPGAFAQLNELAYDSQSILTLNSDWSRTDAEDRLRVLRVIADEDAIVPKFSALGANFAHTYKVVPKYGHIDIVKVQDVNHPSFAIAKAFLLEPTASQPSLINIDRTPPVLVSQWRGSDDIEGTSRFVYLSRYIPFVGRDKEKKQLAAFLHNPVVSNSTSNMAWIWIKGEGGVGKSRLALEFCLAWQSDWHAGFLNQDADHPDWSRWQPQLPTLLVIDYATTDTKKLGQMLRGLCNRDPSYSLRRPVRVLLIDRQQREEELLKAIGKGHTSYGVNACRQPDLDLVTVDDPWVILEHFLLRAEQPLPEKEKVLETLTRIDTARRPLFVMLLADAIIEKVPLGTITSRSLLENVLEREREQFWGPAISETGVNLTLAQRLLAFATMVNGLSLSNAQPPVETWDPDKYSSVFRLMSGYNSQTDQIAPLAPDILGECFALQQLTLQSIEKRRAMVVLAWDYWPWETFAFFDRVTQDFPEDSIFSVLLEVNPSTSDGRATWAAWIVNLIGRTAGQYSERALSAFDALSKLVSTAQVEQEMRLRHVQAAVNLICDLAPSHPKIAKSVFKQLGLVTSVKGEADIRLAHAEALSNLINGLALQEPNSVKAFLNDLSKLSHLYPDELDIRLLYMQSLMNWFQELDVFAESHPNNPMLRIEQANVASELISNLATSEPLMAIKLFESLCAFATKYPDEPYIRVHQAKAAAILTHHLVAPSRAVPDTVNAKVIFDILCALAVKFSDEQVLKFHQAQAALSLISNLAIIEPKTAKKIFIGLNKLATQSNNPEINYEYAKAAVNFISLIAVNKPQEAIKYFEMLCINADTHPNEPKIRECQAIAAVNLIKLLALLNAEIVKLVFINLCELAAKHPKEQKILQLHAHGEALMNLRRY